MHFEEVKENYYKPRSLFVDLDPLTIDLMQNISISKMLNQDYLISGYWGSDHSYAKGYFLYGSEISEQICDQIRKMSEGWDYLTTFQVNYSTLGGTGSGLSSLILRCLTGEYLNYSRNTAWVLPSSQSHHFHPIECYNTVLALDRNIYDSDITYVFDFEGCYNYLSRSSNKFDFGSQEICNLISNSLSRITASIRFPWNLNFSLLKMAVNLVPFPRDHFATWSIESLDGIPTSSINSPELISQLFNKNKILCDVNPTWGRYFSAHTCVNGNISNFEIENMLNDIRCKESKYFMEWLPSTYTYSLAANINSDLTKSLLIG